MAERQIGHRKSCLVLSARFPVVNCLSCPVAKSAYYPWRQKPLYLSVNVFCTQILIEETIFTSPTGDVTSLLSGHMLLRSSRFQSKGSALISQLFQDPACYSGPEYGIRVLLLCGQVLYRLR